MFALYESKLDNDIFKPRDNHIMFKIRDSEKLDIRENLLREEQIPSALGEKEVAAELRVLYYLPWQSWLACANISRFCAERIDVGIESVPLPLTSKTWTLISSTFGIPSGFINYLVLHASIATEFTINSSQQGKFGHNNCDRI